MTEELRPIKIMLLPVEENMQRFDCSPLQFSVESRILNPTIQTERYLKVHDGEQPPERMLRYDRGGTLHVSAPSSSGEMLERLRFDCFEERPHYHYICQSDDWCERYSFDEALNGLMSQWVLQTVGEQLPAMLRRVKVDESVLAEIDEVQVRKVLGELEETFLDAIR